MGPLFNCLRDAWDFLNGNLIGTLLGAFVGFLLAMWIERAGNQKEAKERGKERLQTKLNSLNVVREEMQSNIAKMEQIKKESVTVVDGRQAIVMPYYNLSMFTIQVMFSSLVNYLDSDPQTVYAVSGHYSQNRMINRMLDMLVQDFRQVELFGKLLIIIEGHLGPSKECLRLVQDRVSSAEKELREYV